jgi:hypothetical protein
MIMKTELFDIFTPQQLQAIKDAIIYGAWGDTSQEFYGKDSQLSETHYAWGFCTNDIYKGGHFKNRRSISGIMSGISKKIKTEKLNFISHCSDWWGDGTGDMMFIAMDVVNAKIEELEEWARID